jgi:hypothetical protein
VIAAAGQPSLKRTMIAATIYFLALFALGFVLGIVRVLFIAPHFGAFLATLAEVPVVLSAAYFTCRWTIRRWYVPPPRSIRWPMAIWFLLLLFLFETLFGALLFGSTMVDQWATLKTPAGVVGLSAQLIAALLPVFVARGE